MLRDRRVLAGVLVSVLGATMLGSLGGCSGGQKQDALMAENRTLRDQMNQLDEMLKQCEQDNQTLNADNVALSQRVAQLESQPATASTSSGFEGISGAQVSSRNGEIVVSVAGDVLFQSGKADLRTSSKSTLDQIASVLASQYPGNKIRVEGYTDSDPIKRSKWESNEHLSAARALSVEKYLVSKGVNKDRIYSAAFGDASQRGTKSESRRVEIVVLASASG